MTTRSYLMLAGTLVATMLAVGTANAANLNGQQITVDLTDTAVADFGAQTVTAAPGPDGSYFGNQFFDVNAGSDQNIFSVTSVGDYCGIDCAGGTIVWTISNLDLGSPLTGIDVLQDIAPVTVDSITATSVSFSYADSAIPDGTYLQVEYLTTPVPEPSTWLLMTGGIGGLGLMLRRAKQTMETRFKASFAA